MSLTMEKAEQRELLDDYSRESDELDYPVRHERVKRRWFSWSGAMNVLLCILNVVTIVVVLAWKTRDVSTTLENTIPPPKHYAQVDPLPTTYRPFHWWTEYSDKNDTEVDAVWDAINPAHGFIAIDREWARDNGWHETMYLPSDNSKGVYLLEAYHMLHCLTIIRTIFWEAVNRADTYTWNPPHAGHCFDSLRQFVVCKADNTPLYTFGRDTAGNGQLRQCRDWNALRDYATRNSACYRDYPPGVDRDHFSLGDHFGYCDGGYDGVITDAERRGNWTLHEEH